MMNPGRHSFLLSASRLAIAASLLTLSPTFGQSLMEGAGPSGVVRIFNTDQAVLEMQEPRTDLPCVVTPIKPFLGFDLRFHAGYEVTVPLKELAGSEDLLSIIFRVRAGEDGVPVYFSQKFRVPPIEEDAKGSAMLQGVFDLGEGKYKIDWLIRDRSERVCSDYWDAEATLPGKDKDLQLDVPPNTIEAAEREPFREEPPITRVEERPLNVKVMVNFAPQNPNAASLQPVDTNALISILRNIAREPRIAKFSLVAFNMQEQRVVYRQEAADQIDFPSLGDAIDALKLGTVDYKRLSQKNSETDFLTGLITTELASDDHPDALIFAGPKVMLDQKVPQNSLREVGNLEYPVFYMNYNYNPTTNPWRDAIGNAVKFFKGQEYTISRPRDLWYAWTEIMSRIVRLKVGRTTTASAQ